MAPAKGALLDPEDWENLIAEKEWKIATKDKETAFANRFSPSYDVLRQNSLVSSISGLVGSASYAARSLTQIAGRKTAEYRAETLMRRVLTAHGGRYTAEARQELLQLHNTALKGKYSIAARARVLETQLRCLKEYLDAKPDPMPPFVYKDLVEILSIACSGDYPETLVQQAWKIVLRELRKEGARQLAGALAACNVGDVHLILRHLAICHVSAWRSLPRSSPSESEPDVRQAARGVSFASDTYHTYEQTTNAFYELLLGLLHESPAIVHAAFDERRLHLLWLKYVPRGGHTIDWAWVINASTSSFLIYPKKLNPDLPVELDCLAFFSATAPDEHLTTDAMHHLYGALSPLASPPISELQCETAAAIQAVYKQHPPLSVGELAHPALPFLLSTAPLLRASPAAAEKALELGTLDALRSLWEADFAPPAGHATGSYVPPERRIRALRIATCLCFAGMAAHARLHKLLCEALTETAETKKWFWELATYALTARVRHAGAHWLPAMQTVRSLAVYVMTHSQSMPGGVDREAAIGDDTNLIWLFQTTSNVAVDAKLRAFALDVISTRLSASAVSWSTAVSVLSSCEGREVAPLTAALKEAVRRFGLDRHNLSLKNDAKRLAEAYTATESETDPDSEPETASVSGSEAIKDEAKQDKETEAQPVEEIESSKPSSELGATTNKVPEPKPEPPTTPLRVPTHLPPAPHFLSDPTDRFIMLLSNASRRNANVACALRDSYVPGLVQRRLEEASEEDEETEWRRRTCLELLGQRAKTRGKRL